MAKTGLDNVFAQFAGHTEETAMIKALGAEIKYRTLTMKESDDFQKKTVKGFDSDGKPDFNFDAIAQLRNEKIALCMIEPKMTVKELEQLSAGASSALIEIESLITGTAGVIDEEGN
tara:strand:- start:11608 stop:11958 length:351 start_codon:yes stop_codon:yes gene_type:complete